MAQDKTSTPVNSQQKAMDLYLAAKAMEAAERDFGKTYIEPLGPGEEISRPDNFLYNALSNPRLNRGLSNLGNAAADVVLGKPSGSDAVDMGAGMIPGVGAGAILAAGGMPGMVDAVGMGELKNLSKIPKYTLEFVQKHFGDRGLKALDNTLARYPKAGKPSVNDAIYIMRSGIGGEQVPAIVPYRSNDIMEDMRSVLFGDKTERRSFDEAYSEFMDSEMGHGQEGRYLTGLVEKARENNDVRSALEAQLLIGAGHQGPEAFEMAKKSVAEMKDDDYWRITAMTANDMAEKFNAPWMKDNMRRMKEIATSPVQDWEKIVEAQERKDARDAEKALRKAEKAATKETPRPQPVKPVESPEPQPEPVQEPVAVVVPEPAAEPAPLTWRDTWSSKNYDPNYFNQFGRKLNEESKRDLFGVDSLAKHWVRQLEPEPEFLDANIRTPLERAHYRHDATNYNEISEEFEKDLKKNIESGNLPGTSIQFLQKFKKNMPVPGKTTPTLVLELSEKPRPIDNPRFWADEAEGIDLYEMLFRPMVDRKLNAKNRTYWE